MAAWTPLVASCTAGGRLAALADERDQGQLRRARLDEGDDELADRAARIGLAREPGRLLGEPVELPDQRRLDERVLGGEVPEHGGDADPGAGGDVLGRAEFAGACPPSKQPPEAPSPSSPLADALAH